ncbi:MAG: zeta toxin family protein, partial [Rhabdochlamydiaceae bacterium]
MGEIKEAFMAIYAAEVLSVDAIYSSDFSYSLPRNVLEGFGKGLGFPENKIEYTPEEFKLLMEDIQDIWNRIIASNPAQGTKAVITAGAPGVGKTTIVRGLWEQQKNSKERYAYICPDDICLKEMTRTYGAMVQANGSPEGLRQAYEKWRGGSNFAHHLITAHLIRGHYNFYFGTTASSDKTGLFLDFLKKNGYSITI